MANATAALFRDAKARERDAKLKRLHEACRLGRTDEVNSLLGDGASAKGQDTGEEKEEVQIDINARDPASGWTAMHFACLRGNLQVLNRLLQASADVNLPDTPYLQTPLHVASKYGHAGQCRLLLIAKADPAARNASNRTALQIASSDDVKAVLLAGISDQDSVTLTGAGKEGQEQGLKGKKSGRYTGRLEDGMISGEGALEFDDGSHYQGGWKQGKRHGRGEYTQPDGETYIGEWAHDGRHGHGELRKADGEEYSGEWVLNRRQGRGKQVWANGARYEGEFYQDEMQGQGLLRYQSGNVYEGAMLDGLRHGKGRMVWAEGRWFEGEWVRDRMHGEGLEQLAGCPYHHALVISIAFYRSRFRLPSSHRQPRASAIARILRDPLLAGYPVENVIGLTDEEATLEAISAALQRLVTSTASNATVLVYFDGAASEIATGPDAGYYLCPFDYDSTDRKATSLRCFEGYGPTAASPLVDLLASLAASNVLLVLNTCSADAMDVDVTVGSPFYREKFMEKLQSVPGRGVLASCKMDEPTYTGTLANLVFQALAGVRDEGSDIDNAFYARIASDGNALYTFNLLDFLRRRMHLQLPKEYKDDPRMHPHLQLPEGGNFVLSRRSHPTRFPMVLEQKRAEIGVAAMLRGSTPAESTPPQT